MKELKGTQTEKNLLQAFAAESQARNAYTYFASIAKKEGYEYISGIFSEIANNEKEHAEIWYKLALNLGRTEENLEKAIKGENEEHTNIYKHFAEIAKEEGFDDIAEKFYLVGEIEKNHEKTFQNLLHLLRKRILFEGDGRKIYKWKCRNCGYIHTGKTPPEKCPVCAHAQSYFEIESEDITSIE